MDPKNSKPEGDAEQAASFLRTQSPQGPWTLAAIEPDGPIEVQTFKGDSELSKVIKWIRSRLGKKNLYFMVNPTNRPMNKKPAEADIGHFRFAHVDCDPLDGESAAEAIERHHAKLLSGIVPLPTYMWVSGNGITALWAIEHPPKLTDWTAVARYKAINIGLISALGGKAAGYDHCQNLDRLARLPYTLNIPDDRKRARGRQVELAGNVEYHPERTYTEFDLPDGCAPPLVPEAAEIGAPVFTSNLADLTASDRVKEIIEHGRVRGETKKDDDSRSAWEAEAICALLRDGIATEVILGVLTDSRFLISERVLERPDPEDYARKEIQRLYQRMQQSISDDFPEQVEIERVTAPKIIKPTPYTWQDPRHIPQRPWLYPPGYIRGYPGLTVAPGGLGKSSLVIVETLAMITNRPLLGVSPHEEQFQEGEDGIRVWYWNGEDPREELERRFGGAMQHYKIGKSDIGDRLFVDSGRELSIRIAEMSKGDVRIAIPLVEAVIGAIRDNRIDVLIIDPFVSSHSVSENDNIAIDRVAKQWSDIANQTRCHVHWVHHNRKARDSGASATIEDARGASALRDAARTRRVLNRMSEPQGKGLVEPGAHRAYFSADPDTSSMIRPTHTLDWFKMESVNLGNGPVGDGDEVGVVTAWEHPGASPLEMDETGLAAVLDTLRQGRWRKDPQAKKWAGIAVANALGLDVQKGANRTRVANMLKEWQAEGILEEYEAQDLEQRRPKSHIRPSQVDQEEDFG